jgi:hypothetical protein
MTTVVAIFDNSRDVDRAVTRLARAELEDEFYGEGIIAAEAKVLQNCGAFASRGMISPPTRPRTHQANERRISMALRSPKIRC